MANAAAADVLIVFGAAQPDVASRGISAFLVPGDAKGITRRARADSLGVRGLGCMDLDFADVRVDSDQLLGAPGQGLRAGPPGRSRAGASPSRRRRSASARPRSTRRWPTPSRRHTFGQPIANYQAIQWMLADMATELDAARMLTLRAAAARTTQARVALEAAMAKLFASEAAHRAADKAMQILASAGYRRGSRVERLFRDVRGDGDLPGHVRGPADDHRGARARSLATSDVLSGGSSRRGSTRPRRGMMIAIARGAAAWDASLRPFVVPVGRGAAVYAGPGSPTNKMIGIGFGEALDAGVARRSGGAVRRPRHARSRPRSRCSPSPAVHAQLAARGYVPTGFEHVLGHPLGDGDRAAAGRRRHRAVAAPDRRRSARRCDGRGVRHARTSAASAATRPRRPTRSAAGSTITMSVGRLSRLRRPRRRRDRRRRLAAPRRRRRAVQRRRHAAGASAAAACRRRSAAPASPTRRAAGCTVGVVVTQPGSKSQQNAQREGFALLYARQLLVKPPATAVTASRSSGGLSPRRGRIAA